MKKIIFIFMLVSLFACAFIATSSSVFASDEAAKEEVVNEADKIRVPQGDVEAFWGSLNKWANLNAAEQDAWQVLGWNAKSWDEEVDLPESENKKWAELSDKEKAAAGSLGYDEASWDAPAPAAAEEAPAKEEAKE